MQVPHDAIELTRRGAKLPSPMLLVSAHDQACEWSDGQDNSSPPAIANMSISVHLHRKTKNHCRASQHVSLCLQETA